MEEEGRGIKRVRQEGEVIKCCNRNTECDQSNHTRTHSPLSAGSISMVTFLTLLLPV